MNSQQIASLLRSNAKRQRLTQADLRQAAGVSRQTLTNVLGGERDYKLSTLLALADRLGLDLVLLPKGAAGGLEGEGGATPPAIKSRVQAALDRVDTPKP